MGQVFMHCPDCNAEILLSPDLSHQPQCQSCGWMHGNGKVPPLPYGKDGLPYGGRAHRRQMERADRREEKKRKREEWRARNG